MTIPSATSQTISLNNAMTSSTKTLNTISERESKPDFYLSFDGDQKKKDMYGHTERSKTISLSSTCEKLNYNYSQRSFKSDVISALRGNAEKESHERIKYKISEEHIHSQICADMSNASDVPFVELGAVYKILDLITDSKVFTLTRALTNNCCKEISRTLQCLLAQHHDKKLEDLLLNDSSLHKCEHCGVISYMVGSRPAIREKIKRNSTKTRRDGDIVTAERDCINDYQNNGQSDILINSTDLTNNVRTRINHSKANTQTEYKNEMSKMKFVRNKSIEIENPNEANNISITKADVSATIKNKFYSDNKTIKKLFTNLKMEKENKNYECNNTARNKHRKQDPLNAMNAYASSMDREEVMREILYEPKSQIDDLLVKRRFNIPQKIPVSQRLLDCKHGGIYPIVDTVKYLAGGQLTELYKKEDELLSKLEERRYTRPDDTRTERSSVLYNSREDYPQRDAGFWLFDESGHLPEIVLDKYHCPPGVDNNRKIVNFPANISRYSRTTETIKTDRWFNYMERDSLEQCTLFERKGKSNTTIFSLSSTENLTHGSLDRKCEINNVEEDISPGRKLVSSKPSLDIARHVRAQIAKDRYSCDAKESTSELCTHGLDVLVRLPSETRRKICHLIKTIVMGKDSIFCSKEYSTRGALNSKKLVYSKSADAVFGHSNKCYKTDNERINICTDDYIATKLSELSKDKNRSQDNSVNICSLDLNKSKDSIRIFHENMTPVSVKSADNSTDKIIRQIVYKDALKNIVRNNDEQTVAQILSIYQKILENSRDMDWKNFREFVEVLHPSEKELWRDVCRTISEETKRVSGDADDNTEICIEIGPINPEETFKTGNAMTCAREIVFELDMTLQDVENFLSKRPTEERLDTHEDAKDVTG